ncbi:MAG TPA: hypothetical protein DHV55_00750 [Clostridiaceae bacterium]|nr:hypothetical protein [Clostridiaceae bacterium]
MDEKIKDVVSLLLYRGPDISDLILEAINEEKEYTIEIKDGLTILKIYSALVYDLKIADIFIYNDERQLIKQVLLIGDKEKIIFDKFQEAAYLIDNFKNTSIAS